MNDGVTVLDAPEDTEIEVSDTMQTQTDTLKVSDRCDLCGSQAYVSVLFETGDLLFCGHHATKFEAKIAEKAVKFVDERWKLSGARLDVSP